MTKTQFITDDHGKRTAVILPIKTYDKILEELEELEDIRLYDEAKKRKQVFVDADKAFKILDKQRKKKNSHVQRKNRKNRTEKASKN